MSRRAAAAMAATLLLVLTLVLLAPLVLAATHYETLGVSPTATAAEIKRAYYKRAKANHPDKVTPDKRVEAERQFKLVAEAHSTLVDKTRRQEYDESLRRPAAATGPERMQARQQQQQRQRQQQPQPQQRRAQQQQAPQTASIGSHEQRAQAQGRSISRMRDFADVLDERLELNRYLLLALYDSRDSLCTRALRQIKFPYPFADWSQEWHGVWWGDLVLAASHDVGPSLQSGRPSAVLAAFEAAVGPAKRSSYGVAMPSCPTVLLQRKGHKLGQGGWDRLPIGRDASRLTSDAFIAWAWAQLEVPLKLKNEYPGPVRVNWIHGGHVKELVTLKQRETTERVVFLGHTLHVERLDRKGHSISDGSSLLIFRVLNESAMVIKPVACVDASSDCEDWQRKGECERNTRFMATECARSCKLCAKKPPAQRAKPAAPSMKPQAGASDSCADDFKDCALWAMTGECASNAKYMDTHCRESCGKCGGSSCTDGHGNCERWAKDGQCTANADYMTRECRRSCGLCGGQLKAAAVAAGTEECMDMHKKPGECERWASKGQCTANAAWMEVHCRSSCHLCCKDLVDGCAGWQQDGQCERNRRFMAKHCLLACGWCAYPDAETAGKDLCVDEDIKCEDCARMAALDPSTSRGVPPPSGSFPANACGLRAVCSQGPVSSNAQRTPRS